MNAKFRIIFAAIVRLLAGAIRAQVNRFVALNHAYARVKENAGAVVIGGRLTVTNTASGGAQFSG